MSNPYFRFKQFTVFHDRCAMKVGTDGVLLGAWANVDKAKTILDIGTGTGLVALMLAQRNKNANITAIDIDKEAISQAKDNFATSPFFSQIRCSYISLQEFAQAKKSRFDTIVSNPPFFEDSLKSPQHNRSLARHTDNLPVEELVELSSSLLSETGRLSLIYPFTYKDKLLSLANLYNLHISRITNVYPTPQSLPKRILIEFSKIPSTLIENDLLLEKERHNYSDQFIDLVKDYYLKY